MGGGTWNPDAYKAFASSTVGVDSDRLFKTRASSYRARTGSKDSLNPLGIKIRESRDSDANPNSTACIIALDVTGSMGSVVNYMAREGLGVAFQEILSRKPISDPHLMFMGIGDVYCDEAPLQVSQFEADDRIIPQLTDLWIEGGGGGNLSESYNLPWYFAGMHTSIDCLEKRNKKGYLFTVGDEETPEPLKRSDIERFIGDKPERDLTNEDLLAIAGRMYHIFHIMVGEGSHARSRPDQVRERWTKLLGQRAMWLSDHTKLSEVVVSAIEVTEGRDKDAVAGSWDGKTALVVADAIKHLPASPTASGGVSRL